MMDDACDTYVRLHGEVRNS